MQGWQAFVKCWKRYFTRYSYYKTTIFRGRLRALGSTVDSIKRNKVDSANIVLKMLARLRDDDFRKIWADIVNKEIKEYDNLSLERYLDHFEYVVVYTRDKTLKIDHVMKLFEHNLTYIRNDEYIKKNIHQIMILILLRI